MLAFRRFTSRRGLPATLLSDNAKSFKSASKDIIRIVRAREVVQHMKHNGVTWKFIVERAAWWGGFWERLIQTMKRALKKVIGRISLSFEELRTLLIEVEGIVNARKMSGHNISVCRVISFKSVFNLHLSTCSRKKKFLYFDWLGWVRHEVPSVCSWTGHIGQFETKTANPDINKDC